MTFYPNKIPVPKSLRTDNFVLVPLTPAHVALDYAALMSNKEMLQLWSGSPWPHNDFTLAENLEDLEWHWDEHQKRIAFTFTVLNPDEDTCLGCVYIKPITDILADNPKWETSTSTSSANISPQSALVRFWMVEPAIAQKLDKTLLFTLRQWFDRDWFFSEVYWHTSVKNQQQITLFQNGDLQNIGRVHLPDRGGGHFLFRKKTTWLFTRSSQNFQIDCFRLRIIPHPGARGQE